MVTGFVYIEAQDIVSLIREVERGASGSMYVRQVDGMWMHRVMTSSIADREETANEEWIYQGL